MIFYTLIILSSFFKALMDSLQFHYHRIRIGFMVKNPNYWNPLLSWENKYKWAKGRSKFIGWLIQNPFVFITDGWHLTQFLFLNSLMLSVIFFNPIFNNPLLVVIDFVVYRFAFGLVFTLFYNYILKTKA